MTKPQNGFARNKNNNSTMKSTLQKQKGEEMHKWVHRLTVYIVKEKPDAFAIDEILTEVSTMSYIAGVYDERKKNDKHTSTKL